MASLSESDWKVFRKLRERALQRMSQRILDESRAVIDNPDKTPHERYLELFQLMGDRNRVVSALFDDPRRSRARMQLEGFRARELLTEQEVQELSPEAQNATEPGEP